MKRIFIAILILLISVPCFADKREFQELKMKIWDKNLPQKVRIYSIQQLINKYPEEGLEELKKIIFSSEDDEIRYIAVSLLGLYQPSKIKEIVISLLDDRYEKIRREAVNIIGTLRIKEAYKELLRHSKDESSLVKYAIIMALGNLGIKEALPYLGTVLESSDTVGKLLAITSIDLILCQQKSTERAIIDKMINLLDDRNRKVRERACLVLKDWFAKDLNCTDEIGESESSEKIMDLKLKLWSKDFKIRIDSCEEEISEYDSQIRKSLK